MKTQKRTRPIVLAHYKTAYRRLPENIMPRIPSLKQHGPQTHRWAFIRSLPQLGKQPPRLSRPTAPLHAARSGVELQCRSAANNASTPTPTDTRQNNLIRKPKNVWAVKLESFLGWSREEFTAVRVSSRGITCGLAGADLRLDSHSLSGSHAFGLAPPS